MALRIYIIPRDIASDAVIFIELMTKLKNVFQKGNGIDAEIDSAFSSQSKPSVSERVLESQQKFGSQFPGSAKKSAEILPKTASEDFGRFDENFVPDRHLDNFDETKNIEDFSKLKSPALKREERPLEFPPESHELATATPRKSSLSIGSGTDAGRVVDELEDIKAQNSEILRRIERIEAKLRK